ncbi:hypothetical protein JHK87_033287 [Glycine soja]|nr:hypothetical protein JHK87_033287 [Glycine soja]
MEGLQLRAKILECVIDHRQNLEFSSFRLIRYKHCSATDTISITINNFLQDGGGDTLVSKGENFELGFFTPNGSSSGKRYLGIWYYKLTPLTVVWVANRDKPLLDSCGAFGIAEDGNLKVLDKSGKFYWGTNLEGSHSQHRIVKLMDNGNLVVSDEVEDQGNHQVKILWQSFANPTDTFLPGMKMDDNLALTSWRSYEDPAPGNFSFEHDQGENQYIIWKRSIRYWKSSVSGKFVGTGEISTAISYFLSNFTLKVSPNNTVPFLTSALYTDTRLVMTHWGQLKYMKMDSEKMWLLVWGEPRDRCSVFNACGNFGSCNSKYDSMCKCLPGFKPNSIESWNAGDFSGGCSRKTNVCSGDAKGDTFLSLKMMKVGNPDAQFNAKDEEECMSECLNNCQCYAYSYEDTEKGRLGDSGDVVCWIWSEDLNNLEEEYEDGCDLHVRVAVSDIESTGRNCGTCGTNFIPYPLSTGPSCGDPMYFSFHCNISTGELDFETPGGTYQVISINPEAQKFLIHRKNVLNCDQSSRDKFLPLNKSFPFHLTSNCYADPSIFSSNAPMKHGVEIELSWEQPLEPICSSLLDCKEWPNSTCNTSSDGKKRSQFICLASDSRGYVQKNSGINLYDSERYVRDLIESSRFKEDDAQAIDIPYFHLESILDATNNFANTNKLGQGGFGPVYKGKFPGGQEIAVKRLSSCSGQGLEEFKNEVVLIAKLQHRNLVRLLGYCVEGDEKMLVYEYMPNRSLDAFIFGKTISCI